MQVNNIDTLIYLIQWRVDVGIPLKDAYNTVVINFHKGVTEDERQQLLEYFMPTEHDDTIDLDDEHTTVGNLSVEDIEELLDLLEDTTPIEEDDDLLNDLNELLDELDNA